MKVLLSCYACSPYQGSEPGMGWNFVKCLSKYHDLHIITESKFEADIEKYFQANPKEKENKHFYFIRKERHKKLRKIYPPSYYWYYKKWQKDVYNLARKLNIKENFDVIHQLNMIGYREPGYLYKIGKPSVWGPIGGFNITPWRLLYTMGLYGFLFYFFRNLINLWQMKMSSRVSAAIQNNKELISATAEDYDRIFSLWGKKSTIIPEVGFAISEGKQEAILNRENKLKICWSGLHIPRKSLNFLLEAVAKSNNKDNIELHIIGDGQCNKKWKRLASKLNLRNIVWHGWVNKEKALEIMKTSHLFTITSLSDATSTVLLEALSLGLPVVALNHLGFANIINEDCGIKIDVKSKEQLVRDLSRSLDDIYNHEDYRLKLAKGAISRAQEFTWEEKAQTINSIYNRIVK